MSKPFKRPALSGTDMFGKRPIEQVAEHDPATTQTREPAKRPIVDSDVPEAADDKAGLKRRVRYEKPHVSLYASEATLKAIKRLALDEDTTAQALYREGLLLMMRKYGIDRGMSVDDI